MSRPEPRQESAPAIEALLNYLIDTGEKPASYGGVSAGEADQQRKGKYQEYRMPVYDGRAIVDQLSLEREGFIFVEHETKVKDFYDEAEVRSVYYPETEQLIKHYSGARRVLVFDHTLRSADSAARETKQISGPVRNAHNDYTEWSGPQRVRDLLPDEAEELLQAPLRSHSNLAADPPYGRARAAGHRGCPQHWHRGIDSQRARLPGSRR